MVDIIVAGTGPFPTDMLRYDHCWPAGSHDALAILTDGTRIVRLQSNRVNFAPTVERWASFGWSVISHVSRYEQRDPEQVARLMEAFLYTPVVSF